MAITWDNAATHCTLKLDGEIDVNCATELKSALLEWTSCGKQAQIDLTAVVSIDITAIQLLWAAARQCHKTGIQTVLLGPLPQAVVESLSCVGFDDFLTKSGSAAGQADSQGASLESADAR